MRKARSLIGLNVVAQAGGEALGMVRDLIFDSNSSELLAVVLSERDLFGLVQAQVVPWHEVISVGRDAIIVQSVASKVKAGSDERLSEVVQRETTLGGTRIMTTDGQELGTLADVYVDEATGRVAGYEISGGFISDTLRGKRFLPAIENVQIGKDVAFVPPGVTGQIEQRAWQPGSWQHATVAASDRFSHLAGNARTKAETLYNNMATTSADKQEAWVIGRIAARDVRVSPSGPANSAVEGANNNADSDYLVRAGEVITPEVAQKARELGLLGNLTLAAVENAATNAYTSSKEKLLGTPNPPMTQETEFREDTTSNFSEPNFSEPNSPTPNFSEPGAEFTKETTEETTEATTASPKPLETVQAKAASAAIGKPAGRTVFRPDGIALIHQGEIITELVLTEARSVGKENEVIASAGLGAAQVGVESAKEQASQLWSSLKSKAEELTGNVQTKRQQADEAALQQRITEVVGQRATRLILDRNDEVIVDKGDIITYAAIERARAAGALEVLLNSVERENEGFPTPPASLMGENAVTNEETEVVEPVGANSHSPSSPL